MRTRVAREAAPTVLDHEVAPVEELFVLGAEVTPPAR